MTETTSVLKICSEQKKLKARIEGKKDYKLSYHHLIVAVQLSES